MNIRLAVFGREILSLDISRDLVEYAEEVDYAEPDGSSMVRLSGPVVEHAADEGDFEDHAYEERPHPFGFSPVR
ncbi:hypothetical protein [Amycolatopsis sp. NPDC003731]